MEPTSEQELKQLLDEGRITEEEYTELLEVIRQKETVQKPVEKPKVSKPRAGYGKAGLTLMILGFILPVIAIILSLLSIKFFGLKLRMFLFLPCLAIGFLCELLAFIFGIIGWKTASGKIAAIGVPCLGLLIPPGLIILSLFSCRVVKSVEVQEARNLTSAVALIHQEYPLDTLEGLLSQDIAEIDEEFYVNGGASLRIVSDSSEKRTIRLYEDEPTDIQSGILVYQAKLKCSDLKGQAYLEMWCDIPGRGEFFSRGLDQPITGTTNWTSVQTPFNLEDGLAPVNVKLNLVIEGVGTVWIDDIKLSSSPL